MVALPRTLAVRQPLLLADELALGLTPPIVRRLLVSVRKAADEGVGVLPVEQHVPAAPAIADRGYIMSRGRVVLEGTQVEMYQTARREWNDVLAGRRNDGLMNASQAEPPATGRRGSSTGGTGRVP